MFLQNKYTLWYYNIVNNAMSRSLVNDYYEKHHIIPKSLGGGDSPYNLVYLTAREHFICHLLLTKMLTGPFKYKMVFALTRMVTLNKKQKRYLPSSRTYEILKKLRSEAVSKTLSGIVRGPMSQEHKRNLSIAKKGKPSKRKGVTLVTKGLTYEEIYGPETAIKLKEMRSKQFKGREFSEETKALWSNNRKGKTTGGKNSNAKAVSIYGVEYSCKKDAMAALKLTLYELNKLLVQLKG